MIPFNHSETVPKAHSNKSDTRNLIFQGKSSRTKQSVHSPTYKTHENKDSIKFNKKLETIMTSYQSSKKGEDKKERISPPQIGLRSANSNRSRPNFNFKILEKIMEKIEVSQSNQSKPKIKEFNIPIFKFNEKEKQDRTSPKKKQDVYIIDSGSLRNHEKSAGITSSGSKNQAAELISKFKSQ